MPIYNNIPIIGKYLKSNSFIDKLSPEEREKIQTEYRDKIKLGANVNFSSNAFNTLERSRISDIQGFSKTLGPDGKPLIRHLNNQHDIKSAITNALKPGDAYKEGKAEFEESIATFKDLVKQIPAKFSVEDLIDTMQSIKNDAEIKINAQHKQEIEALDALFKNDSDFRKQLQTAYSPESKNKDDVAPTKSAANTLSDEDIALIKKNMKADLQASHTKQLGDFNKSTADSMKQLQDSSALEKKQLEFLVLLAKLDNENKVKFEQKALEQEQASGINIAVKPGEAKFTGSLLKDLDQFKTITGKTVTKNSSGTDTSYTIEMSRNIFSPLYYLDPRQSLKADYRLMVKACMADGKEQFNWTFDYDDQDSVMAHAREAYKASIEEGADPAKIKMEDGNGHKIKPEEAFKNQPNVLKKLHQQSAEVIKELANQKPQTATNQAAVKEEIKVLREKAKVTYEVAEPEPEPEPTVARTP